VPGKQLGALRVDLARGHTRQIAAFWDTHDLADFAEQTRPVAFEVDIKKRRFLVAVDPGILREVRNRAATRGLSPESLVNLWLKEKLAG
jgi:predicted DNA binding CopG/RHH family protein